MMLVLAMFFMDMVPKAPARKAKNKQAGPRQTKKLPHSRRHRRQRGRHSRAVYLMRVNVQNVKETHDSTAKKKKKDRINLESRNRTGIFQRRHTNRQRVPNVLDITDHQGRANQTHDEMSPHAWCGAVIATTRGGSGPGAATVEDGMVGPRRVRNAAAP